MAKEILLRQNVLTDNVLIIAGKGKIFKGGYVAIIKENRFKNAWADEEMVTRFRSVKRLYEYLDKNYSDVEIEFNETCLENN